MKKGLPSWRSWMPMRCWQPVSRERIPVRRRPCMSRTTSKGLCSLRRRRAALRELKALPNLCPATALSNSRLSQLRISSTSGLPRRRSSAGGLQSQNRRASGRKSFRLCATEVAWSTSPMAESRIRRMRGRGGSPVELFIRCSDLSRMLSIMLEY